MRTRAWQVAILVFDEVDLLDVAAILHVLSETGRHYNFRPFHVTLVSEKGQPVQTRAQTTLIPEQAFGAADAAEILVIPGGYGARLLLENAAVISWLTENVTRAEWVLAVGEGVLPLAKSIALGDARVAAADDVARLLLEFAPAAQVDPGATVAVQGKFGFAKLSAHALDLALEMVTLTLGESFALRTAWSIGYRWAPLQADVLTASARRS